MGNAEYMGDPFEKIHYSSVIVSKLP